MPMLGPLLLISAIAATPYRPTDDALVLGPVTSDAPSALKELRAIQSPGSAAEFARRMLLRAEESQDPTFAQYALAAVERQPGADAEQRVLRATILQRLHRFDAALAELDVALEAPDPPAQGYFVRAVLRTLRADYAGALRDCAALLGRIEALGVAACAALPRARSGQAEIAYSALVDMLDASTGDNEVTRYAHGVAAELAWRLAKPDALERLRRAAAHGKPLQRLAYADALIALGHNEEALTAIDAMPGEGAMLRRARALCAVGDKESLPALVSALWAGIDARALRGDASHAREDAYFFAYIERDAKRALKAAQANFKEQKEPIDAELLLDAAELAGDDPAMESVRRWLSTHAIADAHLEQRLAR